MRSGYIVYVYILWDFASHSIVLCFKQAYFTSKSSSGQVKPESIPIVAVSLSCYKLPEYFHQEKEPCQTPSSTESHPMTRYQQPICNIEYEGMMIILFTKIFTFPEYGASPGFCERHSGAVKAGVPAVLVRKASGPSNSLLTPRSAILTLKGFFLF